MPMSKKLLVLGGPASTRIQISQDCANPQNTLFLSHIHLLWQDFAASYGFSTNLTVSELAKVASCSRNLSHPYWKSSSQPDFLRYPMIHVLGKRLFCFCTSVLHNYLPDHSHKGPLMLLTLSQTFTHPVTLRLIPNNPLSSPLRGHRLVHSIPCLTWYSMFCEKLPVFFSTSSCILGSVSSNPRTSIGIRWLLR